MEKGLGIFRVKANEEYATTTLPYEIIDTFIEGMVTMDVTCPLKQMARVVGSSSGTGGSPICSGRSCSLYKEALISTELGVRKAWSCGLSYRAQWYIIGSG